MIKKFNNKRKKGFTLVELIAVIAIIGILAAVIVPMVGKYTIQAKVAKGTEQMRQFVMAMETAAAEVSVAIVTTSTPSTADKTEPGTTANGIVTFADLKMIQDISFEDCKEVINGNKTANMGTGDNKDIIVVL